MWKEGNVVEGRRRRRRRKQGLEETSVSAWREADFGPVRIDYGNRGFPPRGFRLSPRKVREYE